MVLLFIVFSGGYLAVLSLIDISEKTVGALAVYIFLRDCLEM